MNRHQQFLEMIANPGTDCIIWPYALSNGYAEFADKGKVKRGHQVACEMANGPRPAGAQSAHNCGRAACINPRHLRWATCAENHADRLIHGTSNRGSGNPMCVLSADDVRSIREAAATGKRGVLTRCAERFGISVQHVSDIVHRKKWAWLDAEDAA